MNIVPLFATHPHLEEWWDYDRNGAVPTGLTAGSNKKFWWKCPYKGHVVLTRVCDKSRVPYNRIGCSTCLTASAGMTVLATARWKDHTASVKPHRIVLNGTVPHR